MTFNFTVLYHDEEIAFADAERFEDARDQAIADAENSFYASLLAECSFSAVSSDDSVRAIHGPLSLYLVR